MAIKANKEPPTLAAPLKEVETTGVAEDSEVPGTVVDSAPSVAGVSVEEMVTKVV